MTPTEGQTTTPSGALAGLDEIINCMAERADVVDGDYGQPEPNTEMEIESDLKRIRTAVAALIARNAELEAEREEVLQVVNKNNELLRDAMAAAEKIVAERNALAAENKALREALEGTVDILWGLSPATADNGCYTDDPKEQAARAALARTPAATTKGNDNG